MKFRYLELFSEIFNFGLYFNENRLFKARPCWYLFWYVWKEETPSYNTMVPICFWGFHFQVHKEGGNPSWEDVLQKKKKKAW